MHYTRFSPSCHCFCIPQLHAGALKVLNTNCMSQERDIQLLHDLSNKIHFLSFYLESSAYEMTAVTCSFNNCVSTNVTINLHIFSRVDATEVTFVSHNYMQFES
jgi:hypothetical protein